MDADFLSLSLSDGINVLHSCAGISSSQVLFTVLTWQFVLHFEVSSKHVQRFNSEFKPFSFHSFCFLSGFMAFFKQAFSRSRLMVSLCYASSLIATIYFAMFAQSTPLTVLFAVAQVITLLLMIMAELPGGMSGLKFIGSMFKSKVTSTLPI